GRQPWELLAPLRPRGPGRHSVERSSVPRGFLAQRRPPAHVRNPARIGALQRRAALQSRGGFTLRVTNRPDARAHPTLAAHRLHVDRWRWRGRGPDDPARWRGRLPEPDARRPVQRGPRGTWTLQRGDGARLHRSGGPDSGLGGICLRSVHDSGAVRGHRQHGGHQPAPERDRLRTRLCRAARVARVLRGAAPPAPRVHGVAAPTTAADPNVREWATSDLERRHAFLATVTLPLGTALELGAIARLTSGAPFTPLVGSDINGDGARNDRAFIFVPATAPDTA